MAFPGFAVGLGSSASTRALDGSHSVCLPNGSSNRVGPGKLIASASLKDVRLGSKTHELSSNNVYPRSSSTTRVSATKKFAEASSVANATKGEAPFSRRTPSVSGTPKEHQRTTDYVNVQTMAASSSASSGPNRAAATPTAHTIAQAPQRLTRLQMTRSVSDRHLMMLSSSTSANRPFIGGAISTSSSTTSAFARTVLAASPSSSQLRRPDLQLGSFISTAGATATGSRANSKKVAGVAHREVPGAGVQNVNLTTTFLSSAAVSGSSSKTATTNSSLAQSAMKPPPPLQLNLKKARIRPFEERLADFSAGGAENFSQSSTTTAPAGRSGSEKKAQGPGAEVSSEERGKGATSSPSEGKTGPGLLGSGGETTAKKNAEPGNKIAQEDHELMKSEGMAPKSALPSTFGSAKPLYGSSFIRARAGTGGSVVKGEKPDVAQVVKAVAANTITVKKDTEDGSLLRQELQEPHGDGFLRPAEGCSSSIGADLHALGEVKDHLYEEKDSSASAFRELSGAAPASFGKRPQRPPQHLTQSASRQQLHPDLLLAKSARLRKKVSAEMTKAREASRFLEADCELAVKRTRYVEQQLRQAQNELETIASSSAVSSNYCAKTTSKGNRPVPGGTTTSKGSSSVGSSVREQSCSAADSRTRAGAAVVVRDSTSTKARSGQRMTATSASTAKEATNLSRRNSRREGATVVPAAIGARGTSVTSKTSSSAGGAARSKTTTASREASKASSTVQDTTENSASIRSTNARTAKTSQSSHMLRRQEQKVAKLLADLRKASDSEQSLRTKLQESEQTYKRLERKFQHCQAIATDLFLGTKVVAGSASAPTGINNAAMMANASHDHQASASFFPGTVSASASHSLVEPQGVLAEGEHDIFVDEERYGLQPSHKAESEVRPEASSQKRAAVAEVDQSQKLAQAGTVPTTTSLQREMSNSSAKNLETSTTMNLVDSEASTEKIKSRCVVRTTHTHSLKSLFGNINENRFIGNATANTTTSNGAVSSSSSRFMNNKTNTHFTTTAHHAQMNHCNQISTTSNTFAPPPRTLYAFQPSPDDEQEPPEDSPLDPTVLQFTTPVQANPDPHSRLENALASAEQQLRKTKTRGFYNTNVKATSPAFSN
ncbi:unnamed protein product [Amoebophrya sp. A120]|nr:unnamed protein product [Amoebophrya sp. A120]|eukprot:GSA120T00011886001.1